MYTQEFRSEAVKKIILRGDRSFASVAREMALPIGTLRSWLEKSAKGSGSMKRNHFGPKSKKFSSSDKFKIILEAAALKDEDLGAYLRRHGLFSADIEQWKAELSEQLTGPSRKDRSEENKLKFANTRLEKEIHRKDKALAEASALLILKKKASILWGTEGEDEE